MAHLVASQLIDFITVGYAAVCPLLFLAEHLIFRSLGPYVAFAF